eukprot:118390_1
MSKYSSTDLVSYAFTTLITLSLLVGIPSVILTFVWRKRRELHVRRWTLLVPCLFSLTLFSVINAINELPYVPNVPCHLQKVWEQLLLISVMNLYVFRILSLLAAHSAAALRAELAGPKKLTDRQSKVISIVSDDTNKPPLVSPQMGRGCVGLWRRFLFHTGHYEWLWMVLTLLEAIPLFVAWGIMGDKFTNPPLHGFQCPSFEGISEYLLCLVLFNALAVIWVSVRIGYKDDAFFIKYELAMVGSIGLVASVVVAISSAFDFNVTVFPLSDFTVSLAAVGLNIVSGVVPVVRSSKSSTKSDRRANLASPAEQVLNILSSSQSRDQFKAHLMSEFSVENMLFYEAVQQFKDLASTVGIAGVPCKTVWASAQNVWDIFMSPLGDCEVNISYHQRKDVEVALKADHDTTVLDSSVFDEAATEVLKMMANDSLPRFIVSQASKK